MYKFVLVDEQKAICDVEYEWTGPDQPFPHNDMYTQSRLLGHCAAILRTSHHLHDECEPILYQGYQFFFGLRSGDLDFLSSLSTTARQNIRSISMTLGHRPFWAEDSGWDQIDNLEEWSATCAYISQHLRLEHFTFDCLYAAVTKNFRKEQWVKDLVQIKGLKSITQEISGELNNIKPQMAKDGEGDIYPDEEVEDRLDKLLEYLRSRMLRPGAPRPKRRYWQHHYGYIRDSSDDELE